MNSKFNNKRLADLPEKLMQRTLSKNLQTEKRPFLEDFFIKYKRIAWSDKRWKIKFSNDLKQIFHDLFNHPIKSCRLTDSLMKP